MSQHVRIAVVILAFVLSASAVRADVYRILDDPGEALQARVDLIRTAESEVHALYFLARNDRITLAAVALLREAKRRGVGSVKLIVDANFHRIPKGVLAHLRDEGVEVRVYHPFTLRHPSWLFRRMHEKVVVVDGARYITGGRNLAEAYFGMAKKRNYVDRDVYVEGGSAADADRHFEDLWSSRHVAELDVHVRDWEKELAARALDEVLGELADEGVIVLDDAPRDWAHGQPEVESVRFLHDPVSGEGPRVADHLEQILEDAQESIVIESPYFIPTRSLLALLQRKLREGVEVIVLTNSLRSTDGVIVHAGYLKYRRRLARAGVDLREYKGPEPLHAKSMVVDRRVALVGSYNIDPRSENLNTEVMCVTEDEAVARRLLDSIEGHLADSFAVRSNGNPPRGLPDVSRARNIRAWAARLFLLPIVEGQL